MLGGSLFELLFVYPLSNNDLSSPGAADTTEKPILLNSIADAEAFISGDEVVVIGFFQVCSQHLLFDSSEPYPTLTTVWSWMWHKQLPKAAPVTKGAGAVTGMWRNYMTGHRESAGNSVCAWEGRWSKGER